MALQGALEERMLTFTNCIKNRSNAEPYIKRRAVRHLERQNRNFGAGTGNLISQQIPQQFYVV
jgi:hypothetical protein